MLMSPKSLNRNTRHNAFRQWGKRTKKKLSEESPSRSSRTTTDLDFFFFSKSASTGLTATSQDANGSVGNMLRLLDPTS